MAKELTIKVKKSKKTGLLYWVMVGNNGERMAHSEGIENTSYLSNLLKRFEAMGFKIEKLK
jgi:hypothetical protein